MMFSLVSLLQAQPKLNLNLQSRANGTNAINALGSHLPEVAKEYGMDAQRLTTLLKTQPSLGVDKKGMLQFTCTPQGAITTTSSTYQLVNGVSIDVFQLHSLPGASKVIYLDFTGNVTSGTQWNTSYTGGADIVSQPFDLDGDTSTFNDAERAMILGIWKRVSEDYAPFAIDVTTQDPGLEALRKTSSSDNAYGIRVVISQTNWYSTNAGGTAYIGSFNWDSDTPCWVFAAQLANGEKYIAEAASHEVGHTLGLYHDGVGGTSPSEYYYGQGDWAPIMGCGYYKTITQFSKGEYKDANNTQDDLATISTYVPFTSDDHGNTLASATILSGPNISGGGTIETRYDIDVFRFDTDAGPIEVNVYSPSPESNLNARIELLDASSQVLTKNEGQLSSVKFSVTVPSGTYYLRISSIGVGDPTTLGYSSYGSIGNYIITGTLVPIVGKQSPIASLTASPTSGTVPLTVTFSGLNSNDPDGTIVRYDWNFGNGAVANGTTTSYTYTISGTYIATLTVTDNDGLTNSATVSITAKKETKINSKRK